jgi:glycosyltransferase involved in cell wall biosynthesis
MAKILRIISRLNIGGPAKNALYLNEYLPDSKLVYGKEDRFEGNMLDLEGISPSSEKVIFIPWLQRNISPLKDIIAFFKIYSLIKREQPLILHTHLAKAGLLGRLAGYLCKVKFIFHTFHGHTFYGYFNPLLTKFFILIEKFLARFTTKIIAVSFKIKQDLIKYKIANEDKIVVIKNGFELEKFRDCKANTSVCNAFKKELNIPESAKVVGTVTRLVKIKRIDLFLQTAKLLEDENIVFLIVGDGEMRAELKKLANKLKIQHKVHFLGFRKDLLKIYGIMDVFLLTSDNEGLPTALIEAQASGVVPVVADVGGVSDTLLPHNGIIVKTNSPKELASAIISALQNKSLQERVNKNKERIIQEYSLNNLLTHIKNLYSEFIGNFTKFCS